MKVYIIMTDKDGLSDNVDKVFLKKEDAEKYCNYYTQWIEVHEVIK